MLRPSGARGPAYICLEPAEVKNEQRVDFQLPARLAEMLNTNLARFPPVLGGPSKGVGVRITPHQFRHIGAKRHLDVNPAGLETLRQLLGHARSRPPWASMPSSTPAGPASSTTRSSSDDARSSVGSRSGGGHGSFADAGTHRAAPAGLTGGRPGRLGWRLRRRRRVRARCRRPSWATHARSARKRIRALARLPADVRACRAGGGAGCQGHEGEGAHLCCRTRCPLPGDHGGAR